MIFTTSLLLLVGRAVTIRKTGAFVLFSDPLEELGWVAHEAFAKGWHIEPLNVLKQVRGGHAVEDVGLRVLEFLFRIFFRHDHLFEEWHKKS